MLDERIAHAVLQRAIAAADSHLMSYCQEDQALLLLMTCEVAIAFQGKVNLMARTEVMKRELLRGDT